MYEGFIDLSNLQNVQHPTKLTSSVTSNRKTIAQMLQ